MAHPLFTQAADAGSAADPVAMFEEADRGVATLARLVACVAVAMTVLAVSAQLLA